MVEKLPASLIDSKQEQDLAHQLSEVDLPTVQEILNDRFSLSERQQKLEAAPLDSKGRKVRYYRYMNMPIFLQVFKKGVLTAMDYFDPQVAKLSHYRGIHDPVSDTDLYSLLSYYNSSKDLDVPRKVLRTAIESRQTEEVLQIIQRMFPDASPDEITETFTEPNYQKILSFVEKHWPLDLLMQMHSGGLNQKFSNLLSLSVGGVIQFNLNFSQKNRPFPQVYVESVLPTETIIPFLVHAQGEKEVFTRAINVENITRVFVSDEQVIQEVVHDPTSALGDFYQQHQNDPNYLFSPGHVDLEKILNDWRTEELTNLCLPSELTLNEQDEK